jgi:hypothetical protein
MQVLRSKLQGLHEILLANAKSDWSTSNPSQAFEDMANNLKSIIDTIPDEREEALERLSHLICDDDDCYKDMEEALSLLEAQAEIDGSVMADEVVMMWEKVEWTFTVDELLSEIGM